MRISTRLQAAFFLAFSLSLPIGSAIAQELPITVADALKRADIPWQAMGLYVQEVGGGPVLVAANEALPLNPASTMKLVTTDAALEMLGPTFTWKTQAYAVGPQKGDVLHGDLIFKGSGDPKLVLENFWLFLRRIRASGIREIRGDVILDRSLFEETKYDPAAFDGDPLKPYNVGPDALLLNFKALNLRFTPDEAHRSVAVAIDPLLASYPIRAPRLARRERDCGDWRTRLHATIDANGARFPGPYPLACGEKSWYVHPYEMSHTQYFNLVFRRLWVELGGKLRGQVRDGTTPASARLVTEWESGTLSEVIRDINKYSNNVMARQLLLTLAYQVLKLPANTEHGGAVLRTWLSNKGIDAPELSIENGSGLSRNERISAATMGRMLSLAYRAPTMPEFVASLPLVGLDGTMRSRLQAQGVAGRAHIKTGLLNEVRAVAGYVLSASGKQYVVACIVNHPNAFNAQEAQDALLEWIYERG